MHGMETFAALIYWAFKLWWLVPLAIIAGVSAWAIYEWRKP